jgi:hypothetical protein
LRGKKNALNTVRIINLGNERTELSTTVLWYFVKKDAILVLRKFTVKICGAVEPKFHTFLT